MEAHDWEGCPLVSIDPEVMHGEPVFRGTRMPVADAIEDYYAYLDLEGKSEEEAVNAVLASFSTIPSPEALRAVLAYEAAHEHPLQP
jgi:uncharacterized protein (DUF433 family)